MERIEGMKKEAADAQEGIRNDKQVLKSLRDNQLNDTIWEKAMASEGGKTSMFRSLAKQAKQIETKIKVLVTAAKGTKTRDDIIGDHLTEQDMWVLNKHAALHSERRSSAVSDSYDSDDNANRGGHKRARFGDAMKAFGEMGNKLLAPLPPTEFEKTVQEWLKRKMQTETAAVSAAEPLVDTETRLAKLKQFLDQGILTQAEHDTRRAQIIESGF